MGVALLVTAAALSGGLVACSSDGKKDDGYRPKNPFAKNDRNSPPAGKPAVTEQELKAEADKLYRVARGALESSDFTEATIRYDLLAERYPFTEYATQGELEKIYVLNRDYKPDEALSAADRFLREHPRHPHADYVQYLKGTIQSERDKGLADSLPIDPSRKDVGNLRKAYDEFSLLIQKYPNSRYNEDARARMMELRNRIADNEMHVVDFYTRRGAWLAAAKRAEQVIAQYPGAPATMDALETLERSYRELGLTQEAEDAARTLAVQTGQKTLAVAPLKTSATGEAPTASATSPSQPAPVQNKGFFSRVAGLFSGLDRSNKEPIELVLPSAASTPAAPVKQPSADGQSIPPSDTAKAEASEPPKKSNKLIIEYNTGEDDADKAETQAPPPSKDAQSSNP
ncbi:MAG: outer membrane protein assembly factor BamD [Stagnimonas sp.]|nr:outer membrane protein assembly factor BamD [Stagnimonas sp.]